MASFAPIWLVRPSKVGRRLEREIRRVLANQPARPPIVVVVVVVVSLMATTQSARLASQPALPSSIHLNANAPVLSAQLGRTPRHLVAYSDTQFGATARLQQSRMVIGEPQYRAQNLGARLLVFQLSKLADFNACPR